MILFVASLMCYFTSYYCLINNPLPLSIYCLTLVLWLIGSFFLVGTVIICYERHVNKKLTSGISPEMIADKGPHFFEAELIIEFNRFGVKAYKIKKGTTKEIKNI